MLIDATRICKLCWRLCPDRAKLETHRQRDHDIDPTSSGAEARLWAECVTWPADRADALRRLALAQEPPSATTDIDLYAQLPTSAPTPMDVDQPSSRRPIPPPIYTPIPYLPPREPTPPFQRPSPPVSPHARSPSFGSHQRRPSDAEYDPNEPARRSPGLTRGPAPTEAYSPDQPALSPSPRSRGSIPGMSWM